MITRKLLTVLIVLIMLQSSGAQSANVHSFSFQLTTGERVSTDDYNDKPIIIEWAASWCSTCKQNQKNMKSIYDDYKDRVHFISISFNNSRDTLDDVKQMKINGAYQWDFALDNDNYAGKTGASNGDMWILTTNLTIYQSWDYSVVSASDLSIYLDGVLSEDPVSQVDNTASEEIEDIGLSTNPLFYGFIGITVIAVVALLWSKKQVK